MKRFMLQGKKIIITGASSGIGLCVSELFVKEGAAKFTILGMTKNIAMRLVGTGIRINALCPGSTLTPMAEAVGDKGFLSYDPEHDTAKTSGVLDVPGGKMQGQSIVIDNGGYL